MLCEVFVDLDFRLGLLLGHLLKGVGYMGGQLDCEWLCYFAI